MAPIMYTLSYAAPETVQAIMRGERTTIVDPAIDVWALGVMAYELLTCARLFRSTSKKQIEMTMAGELALPWEDTASADFVENEARLGWMRATICSMLNRDPAQRPTLAEVVHQWRLQNQQPL